MLEIRHGAPRDYCVASVTSLLACSALPASLAVTPTLTRSQVCQAPVKPQPEPAKGARSPTTNTDATADVV